MKKLHVNEIHGKVGCFIPFETLKFLLSKPEQ